MPRPWTDEEDAVIRNLYRIESHARIGKRLGRSGSAVRNRCWRLGLQKKVAFWTEEEIDRLHRWYKEREGLPVDLDELARDFGRPKTSVCKKARDLGLTNNARPHDAEAKKKQSKARQKWMEENEHPRGMKGKHHPESAKRRIGEASREYLNSLTDEEWEDRIGRAIRTKLERYGTGNPANKGSNPYSRTKSGKRADLNNQFFRSRWEANYARYLNLLVKQGKIRRWEYEPDTFIFEGVTRGAISYTPDFKVFGLDGSHEYHEVKGWMDGPSKTRLKRMAQFHPHETVIVIGQKEYKVLERTIAGAIPNWEIDRPKYGRAA